MRRAKRFGSWVPPAGSGEAVVGMSPRLDRILISSYAQLLATVEELKALDDELQRPRGNYWPSRGETAERTLRTPRTS